MNYYSSCDIFESINREIKKMEIFKLFNESFSRNPDKDNKLKSTKCECSLLSTKIKERDDEIVELKEKIGEYEQQLNEVKDYEKQVQTRIIHLEQSSKRLQDKISEQDVKLANMQKDRDTYKSDAEITSKHLQNVEFAFNDVHSKYERAKNLIEELKENEINLQKCIQTHENTIDLLMQQYEGLKIYSVHQFEEANAWVNNVNAERENAMAQLKSKIKKLEITTAALDQNLQQKTLENEQLSLICDELINKQHTYYITGVKTK